VDPWEITTSYTYNKLGQQPSRTLTSAAGTAQRSMSWDYNEDGSLKLHTDQGTAPGLAELLADDTDGGAVTVPPHGGLDDRVGGRSGRPGLSQARCGGRHADRERHDRQAGEPDRRR
jgi:hypothetical protein